MILIGCIIQARMGSSRLPGKVLKKINGKVPMLKFQLDQLKYSKYIILQNKLSDQEINECYPGYKKMILSKPYSSDNVERIPKNELKDILSKSDLL